MDKLNDLSELFPVKLSLTSCHGHRPQAANSLILVAIIFRLQPNLLCSCLCEVQPKSPLDIVTPPTNFSL